MDGNGDGGGDGMGWDGMGWVGLGWVGAGHLITLYRLLNSGAHGDYGWCPRVVVCSTIEYIHSFTHFALLPGPDSNQRPGVPTGPAQSDLAIYAHRTLLGT